jgi:hypothetical protein
MNPLYERCYRCRAMVPNGLVKRRTMQTGYSSGFGLVSGRDHYAIVSLCGVCEQEVREEEGRRGAAIFRYLGVGIGTIALTWSGVLWPISLAVWLVLARLRLVGRALIAGYVVAEWSDIETLYPAQLPTHFVLPWAAIMGGFVGWKLWRRVSGRWLMWKQPLTLQRRES